MIKKIWYKKSLLFLIMILFQSCSYQRNLVEVKYEKSWLTEDFGYINDNDEFHYSNHRKTLNEKKYFKSVLQIFYQAYSKINFEEYLIQYTFTKNKYGETEVYMRAVHELGIPHRRKWKYGCISGCGGLEIYAIINVSREKAFFHHRKFKRPPVINLDYDAPNDIIWPKDYFFIKDEYKEIDSDSVYINDVRIWRDFDFDDWEVLEESETY